MGRPTDPAPTFRTTGLSVDLPDRKEMLAALERGIKSVLFEARYLTEDDASNIVEDQGGLERFAPIVGLLFEHGFVLTRMFEALSPDRFAKQNGEEGAAQP